MKTFAMKMLKVNNHIILNLKNFLKIKIADLFHLPPLLNTINLFTRIFLFYKLLSIIKFYQQSSDCSKNNYVKQQKKCNMQFTEQITNFNRLFIPIC